MHIAFTMTPGRGDTDLLLYGLAELLQSKGIRTAGVVQTNTECEEDGLCDMDVRVLPDGPSVRISQSLGRGARGCRLDPEALETAVGLSGRRLDEGADCLIVNKFGKHEAEGRGFRTVIAEALSREIPVLVGLNRKNAEVFQQFTGGMAVQVPANESDLLDWLMAAMADDPAAHVARS